MEFLTLILVQIVLQVLIPLNVNVQKAVAQLPETDADCPAVRARADDRFLDILRDVESEGDTCKISGSKIGPYQISEEYYDEAVEFNEDLTTSGEPRAQSQAAPI